VAVNGPDGELSSASGRYGVGTMQPPFPGPTPVAVTATQDRGFYRSPIRVALLAFLAPASYELWWYWQLFKFTRREGFARARAFWWILIPFYGWYVIYQQLDDLKQALAQLASPIAFSSAGAAWLVILSNVSGSASNRADGTTALVLFFVSGILIAAAAYLTQNAANTYQEVRYPGRARVGITRGEAIAALIGLLLFAAVIAASFLPASG
jgi:hypothetical protein